MKQHGMLVVCLIAQALMMTMKHLIPTTTLDMNVRYDALNIAVNNINGTNIIQLTRSVDWPNRQKG